MRGPKWVTQGPDCTPQHDTCNGRGRDCSWGRDGRRRLWRTSLAQPPRLLPDGEPPQFRGMGFNYNVTDGVIELRTMKQPSTPSGRRCIERKKLRAIDGFCLQRRTACGKLSPPGT